MAVSVILFLCALTPVLWAVYPAGLGAGLAVGCVFLLGLVWRKPGFLCVAFLSFVGLAIHALALGHFVLALLSAIFSLAAWDLGNLSIWSQARLPRSAVLFTGSLSLGMGAAGALLALLGKNLTLRLSPALLFLLLALLWLTLWLLRKVWE